MKKAVSVTLVLTGLFVSTTVSAKQLWSDFSISYLNGNDYELGDNSREVITFEHASVHNWGDNFLFIDRTKPDSGDQDTYFELHPRLSLSYVTGSDLSFGPIKDIYLAGQWESKSSTKSTFDNYLTGIGLALKVPGFRFFKANLYHVNNEKKDDDTQMTIAWAAPFKLGDAEFLYDGFVDWASAESDHASELNFTSQLKWNVGKVMGTSSPLYVGIEYAYWNNKFGVKGVDERNPSLLIKWHF